MECGNIIQEEPVLLAFQLIPPIINAEVALRALFVLVVLTVTIWMVLKNV